MRKDQRGLGKGIGALFGDISSADALRKPVGYVNKDIAGQPTAQPSAGSDVFRVPVDLVEPNPFQPRLSFDKEALEELADSIRTLGLIQPITVRRISDSRYQIISGERRFRACRMAGMTQIPAYVRDAGDQGMLEMALVENIQRENLDPIETALSYQRLMDECNLTQEQMADRVGKKRATIANSLRLLSLPAKVQHDLKLGLLSSGHAKAILGIDVPSAQEQLCDLAVRDGLSVRQIEEMVRSMRASGSTELPGSKKPSAEPEITEDYNNVVNLIGKYFEKPVSIRRNASGSGSMTIHFKSDEEVGKFLKLLEDKQF